MKKLRTLFVFLVCGLMLSAFFAPQVPFIGLKNNLSTTTSAYALETSDETITLNFPSYSSQNTEFNGSTQSLLQTSYSLETWLYLYFTYDKSGTPIESASYQSSNAEINSNETALIIMDPWIDMPSDYFTALMSEIVICKIIPLAEEMQRTGHQIIILTNDPASISCTTKIHPKLQKMVDNHKATLLYHQSYSSTGFQEYFKERNINTLIYTGFSSTMCILYRPAGIIPMHYTNDFNIFFVPDASYATVSKDQAICDLEHKSISLMLSCNGIARLIDYDYYLRCLKLIPSVQSRVR